MCRPYSSGLPGQWMSHQIDTVHCWFTGLPHPRAAWWPTAASTCGRTAAATGITMTAVFLDYGPAADPATGFQVTFASRMRNGEERPAEIYYANGGELNLNTNRVSPTGGLTKQHADRPSHLPPNLLAGSQPGPHRRGRSGLGQYRRRLAHLQPRPQLDGVRASSRQAPNAPVEAGYSHSIANIMTTATPLMRVLRPLLAI
ncbi:MAG: hypothetical protein WKG07_05470 [Hymenobacter sp.]